MSSLDAPFLPDSLIYKTQRLISAWTYMQTHMNTKLEKKISLKREICRHCEPLHLGTGIISV